MQEPSSPWDGCVLSSRNETLSSHPVLQEDCLSWRPPQVEGRWSPSLQPGPPPVSCVPCRPPFLFVFRTLSLALPTWRGSGEAEPSSLAPLGAQLCNDYNIFRIIHHPSFKTAASSSFLKNTNVPTRPRWPESVLPGWPPFSSSWAGGPQASGWAGAKAGGGGRAWQSSEQM